MINVRRISVCFVAYFSLILWLPSKLHAETVASTVPVDGLTTADLIDTGVKGIPGCIGYCVTGICTHIKFGFLSVKIIISPMIAHNTPEFVVSAYRAQGQQPWVEWRKVFGKAQSTLADDLFNLVSKQGQLGGYGTYTEEVKEYDKQAPFKEVDINGHPLSLLPSILSNGRITFRPPVKLDSAIQIEQTNQNGSSNNNNNSNDKYSEAQNSATQIVGTQGMPAVFMDPKILDVFSYADTINQIGSTVDQVSQVMDYFSSMQDLVGGGAFSVSVQFSTDHMLCPNVVLPFTPYYLSALDTLSWRIPWADVLRHSGDIARGMVPFTSDRPVIGTGSGGTPAMGEGTWGGLYPRMGFVRNEHDGKVGAVVSQRALDLMLANRGQDNFGHPMVFDPGFPSAPDWHVIPYEYHSTGIQGGVWQAVFPKPSYQCTSSLYKDMTLADMAHDQSAPTSKDQHYIWAFWRRYECCMNLRGMFVAAVRIGPICLTPEKVDDPKVGFEGI